MKFYPQDVQIFKFDTVTWVFNAPEPHTVSFIDGFSIPFNPFDPRIVPLQQEVGGDYFDNSTSNSVSSGLRVWGAPNYTLTFNQTGNFPYLCAIHPSMVATLRVRDWNEALAKSADEVLAEGSNELASDSTYALGDFIKQANLLSPVQYSIDSDGYRTWNVWDGVYAQPSGSNVTGVGPISAFDFYPGNGVFNISQGDRIKFTNADQGIHTLALQENSTFIPYNGTNYVVAYLNDSQVNLMFTGGFEDYGIVVPLDPARNSKTITFGKEGTFYVFCALHSDLGMHAQINVLQENNVEANQTSTTPSAGNTSISTGTGGSGGIGGGGIPIATNETQTNTGAGTGTGTGTGPVTLVNETGSSSGIGSVSTSNETGTGTESESQSSSSGTEIRGNNSNQTEFESSSGFGIGGGGGTENETETESSSGGSGSSGISAGGGSNETATVGIPTSTNETQIGTGAGTGTAIPPGPGPATGGNVANRTESSSGSAVISQSNSGGRSGGESQSSTGSGSTNAGPTHTTSSGGGGGAGGNRPPGGSVNNPAESSTGGGNGGGTGGNINVKNSAPGTNIQHPEITLVISFLGGVFIAAIF